MDEGALCEYKSFLVIVAHMDDAEFGCAGSVAKWASEGRRVDYVVCTDGSKGTKDLSMNPHRLAELREQEQLEAASVLGVNQVIFLRHLDGELEVTKAFRNQLALIIRALRPDVVVTHDSWRRYLVHPDHRAVGVSVMDAIVSARDHLFLPEQRLAGIDPHGPAEVLFSYPDDPDLLVDISGTMDRKLEALSRHRSQLERLDGWRERVKAWCAGNAQGTAYEYVETFKRVVL